MTIMNKTINVCDNFVFVKTIEFGRDPDC